MEVGLDLVSSVGLDLVSSVGLGLISFGGRERTVKFRSGAELTYRSHRTQHPPCTSSRLVRSKGYSSTSAVAFFSKHFGKATASSLVIG